MLSKSDFQFNLTVSIAAVVFVMLIAHSFNFFENKPKGAKHTKMKEEKTALETIVYSEADREELLSIIDERTDYPVSKAAASVVFDALPECMAELLKASTPHADGTIRCEIYGNVIITLKYHEAYTADVFGASVEVPAGYRVYTKLHSVALDALEAQFGMPCRNG